MEELDKYERWYLSFTLSTLLRCKSCGVVSEITDREMQTAIRIEINHDCWALPKGSEQLKLEAK